MTIFSKNISRKSKNPGEEKSLREQANLQLHIQFFLVINYNPTQLSCPVWENRDLGYVYRPYSILSILKSRNPGI